jgi:RecG-like helicase
MMALLTRRRPAAPALDAAAAAAPPPSPADTAIPIATVAYRQRVRVAGRVRSLRIQPWQGAATLECTVMDETAGLLVIFLGRRRVAGVDVGTELVVEGMVGAHRGRLAMLNPDYWLLAR